MAITDTTTFFALPLALLFGMLIAMEIGRRIGQRKIKRDPESARAGSGTVEAALFGLLGLIVAFTFNGAASRFDDRRSLIVEEVNAIGTAWTRLDMLPDDYRNRLRGLFRDYLDLRLKAYRLLPNRQKAESAVLQSQEVQQEIWKVATEACLTDQGKLSIVLVLPAMNTMFDISTTRTMVMLYQHPPTIIFIMLFILSITCSILAGHGMASSKSRSWLHMVGFALITSVVVYVILDLEHPRLGFIQVKGADQSLVDLRESMK